MPHPTVTCTIPKHPEPVGTSSPPILPEKPGANKSPRSSACASKKPWESSVAQLSRPAEPWKSSSPLGGVTEKPNNTETRVNPLAFENWTQAQPTPFIEEVEDDESNHAEISIGEESVQEGENDSNNPNNEAAGGDGAGTEEATVQTLTFANSGHVAHPAESPERNITIPHPAESEHVVLSAPGQNSEVPGPNSEVSSPMAEPQSGG